MEQKILKREDFSKFLNTLKLFQEHCTDCEISNGIIRQRSNDRHSIFEMDLTSVIGDTSFLFVLIKNKIGLLKAFELDTTTIPEGSDQNISLDIDERNYKFTDLYSTMKFRIPLKKYLDNVFIDDSEFEGIFKLNEEDLILSTNINSYLTKRIKAISEGFENDVITLKMNEFTGDLEAETGNKENNSELVRGIELNAKMPKCQTRMIVLPFTLELNSDIKIDIYKVSSKVVIGRFQMKFFGVPITMYSQSELTTVK
jgi:hypothetical protein